MIDYRSNTVDDERALYWRMNVAFHLHRQKAPLLTINQIMNIPLAHLPDVAEQSSGLHGACFESREQSTLFIAACGRNGMLLPLQEGSMLFSSASCLPVCMWPGERERFLVPSWGYVVQTRPSLIIRLHLILVPATCRLPWGKYWNYPPLLGYALGLHFKETGGGRTYCSLLLARLLLARLVRMRVYRAGVGFVLGDLIRCAVQRL